MFNIKQTDTFIVLWLFVIVAISGLFPYPPFLTISTAASGAAILWLASRFNQKETKSSHVGGTAEQKSAQAIIADKLNNGVIEKAIDERFDNMVNGIVDDLFGKYGDINKEIKKKLESTMNPYIEQYNFGEHAVKLEHLLNQMIEHITADQTRVVENMKTLMGVDTVTEIKVTELFDKFAKHIGENIDTDKLEIDYDDSPSYEHLTAEMTCDDEKSYGGHSERKSLKFTCEQDDKLGITITIHRWTGLSNKSWHIESITRFGEGEKYIRKYRDAEDITTMETPIANLKNLNELEVFLLKLHYDETAIILDETEITDEDVEVQAEPEAYLA